MRAVDADAAVAGLLSAGVLPAAGAAGLRDRSDFLAACEKWGALHGVTPRKKTSDLASVDPLGDTKGLPTNAASLAAGEGDAVGGPTTVGNGAVVWHVADYLPARAMTLDEAKETIRRRLVHNRAAEAARKAAEAFQRSLEEGKEDVSGMEETPLIPATSARARPFALLGAGEVCREVAAVEAEGDEQVLPDEALSRSLVVEFQLGPAARRAPAHAPTSKPPGRSGHTRGRDVDAGEKGMTLEAARRLADKLVAEAVLAKAGRFRVAVLVEREPVTLDAFRKDAEWRRGRAAYYSDVRRAFLRDQFSDAVTDAVRWRQKGALRQREE